jgi:hypothetical protein
MMESLPQETPINDLTHSRKRLIRTNISAGSLARPVSGSSGRKLKIRESLSWMLCFAVLAGITGTLLAYKVGITMSGITSILFYCSLLGLLLFTIKLVRQLRPEH